MAAIISHKRNYGRTTFLTLNMFYTLSISTFLFALFCYFKLDIKEVIFKTLLVYSIANTINIGLYYFHKNIIYSYIAGSILAYVTLVVITCYSGGINSPALPFMVLIVFFGYLIKKFYGNFWLVVVFITASGFYALKSMMVKMNNEISQANQAEFNLLFLIFLIVLLGGVFGSMMNNTNEKIKAAKLEIVQKNNEKAVMLKEIHHRVKNNLQVVNSLLRMQARAVDDESVKLMFKLTQDRVVAMARLHEKIYNTDDLVLIDVKEHFRLLVRDLIHSYNLERHIVPNLNVHSLKMSIDTLLPLSLIVNELVANSLKYAYNGVKNGELYVSLKKENNQTFSLVVGNNGSANDVAMNYISLSNNNIIKTFVRQLNGNFSTANTESITNYILEFSGVE